MHFDVPRDFFDLVVKSNLSSRSRATAFLWLMWWYLESDFSSDDALRNPYGPGRKGRPDDPDDPPIKCPQFEILTDEQEVAENVDTQEEIDFGQAKQEERRAILTADMAPVITGAKRSGKRGGPGPTYSNNPVFQVASEDGGISSPSRDPNSPAPPPPPRGGYKAKPLTLKEYASDTDRTRSASPPPPPPVVVGGQMGMFKPTTGGMRITAMLNETASPEAAGEGGAKAKGGPGRGNWRRRHGDGVHHTPKSFAARQQKDVETASVASAASTQQAPSVNGPHGFYLPLNGSDVVPKRSRPLTHHQIAVEKFRREKVNYILHRSFVGATDRVRKERRKRSSWAQAWMRSVDVMSADRLYDSEEEGARVRSEAAANGVEVGARQGFTMGGVRPAEWEEDDWGEWSGVLAKGLRRAGRRLNRWEKGEAVVRRQRGEAVEESTEIQEVVKAEDAGGHLEQMAAEASSPMAGHEDDADVENEGEDEVLGDAEEMDEDDNETVDAMDPQDRDEVMAGA